MTKLDTHCVGHHNLGLGTIIAIENNHASIAQFPIIDRSLYLGAWQTGHYDLRTRTLMTTEIKIENNPRYFFVKKNKTLVSRALNIIANDVPDKLKNIEAKSLENEIKTVDVSNLMELTYAVTKIIDFTAHRFYKSANSAKLIRENIKLDQYFDNLNTKWKTISNHCEIDFICSDMIMEIFSHLVLGLSVHNRKDIHATMVALNEAVEIRIEKLIHELMLGTREKLRGNRAHLQPKQKNMSMAEKKLFFDLKI